MDLLLSRYSGNIEFILDMDIDDSLSLIHKALEKRRDDELFQIYLVHLPNMDEKSFKTFGQYKDEILNAHKAKMASEMRQKFKTDIDKKNKKSDIEAINEAEEILQMMNGKGATT